jgi:hypothetical protein
MSEVPLRRPAGVTLVAALTWIAAFFDVVVGTALLLLSFNGSMLVQIGAPAADVRVNGLASIAIGLLTGLVASGLSRGRNSSRVLVVVLMALGIASAGYGLWAIQNFTVWTGLGEIALAVIVIAILSGKRASAYFRQH